MKPELMGRSVYTYGDPNVIFFGTCQLWELGKTETQQAGPHATFFELSFFSYF